MRLPHTDSAEAIWAFKKGYRFAEQGKPLNQMPVTVRAQPWLRDYFMQGYEQAQAERLPPRGDGLTPRKRAIWLLFAALAGLGTAWLMIRQIQADKATVAPATVAQTGTRTPQEAEKTPPVAEKATMRATTDTAEKSARKKVGDPPSAASDPAALSRHAQPPAAGGKGPQPDASEPAGLLDAEARAKQQVPHALPAESLPPVVSSSIRLRRHLLAGGIREREPVQPLGDTVPRSVRRLYFFTEVENARGQTLHHRWYHGNRLMADIALPIGSNRYRTWSSKRLTPAWQGAWRIDVTDEKGQVIARKHFTYGRGQVHE